MEHVENGNGQGAAPDVARGLPLDLTPLNIKAYLYNNLGLCGCSELDEIVAVLLRLLEWHGGDKETRYDELFPGNVGVFYLLAGMLDGLGLSEHGTAIRHPWLTEDGKRLLAALRRHPAQEIDDASGEAYDGCHYGDV